MPSAALSALVVAVGEVTTLGDAKARSGSAIGASLALSRVVGRARVVLLSSHFEHYFYAVNEEATTYVNGCGLASEALPERLRLEHSRSAITALEQTSWENRAGRLTRFVGTDGWLWTPGTRGTLDHTRILTWMKSPKPDSLVRFYSYWGVEDVFKTITRKPRTKLLLRLQVQQLVDLRNLIAHGDFSAQATASDVRRYSGAALNFCRRADDALAASLARLTRAARPW